MRYKAIAAPVSDVSSPRNSIAGPAWMPLNSAAPSCTCCQTPMQLFVQFDIEASFAESLASGSHFVLFMCPQCNEIPCFEDFNGRKLPDNYWNATEGNHYAALFPPDAATDLVKETNRLQAFELNFVEDAPNGKYQPNIWVGGKPQWIQESESFTCSCGEVMEPLAQITDSFPFPKLPEAASQADSFSKDDYCLFLGNEVYVFVCGKQCNERSVWITVQN